jgi:3-hydroxyacyl-[acyl-carrier-protein] dehydratase
MSGLIDRLPHRAPFRFVTEVVSADPASFEALWRVDGTEDFLRGHFPGDAIVPGVLITEALAQAAGLHLLVRGDGGPHRGMLVQSEMRFRKPVRPPADIVLLVKEEGSLGALHRFEVRALVGDGLVAEGMLVLAIARGNAAAATS